MRAQAAILSPNFRRRAPTWNYAEAVRQIPGGVGLLTARAGAENFGVTATSVAPLSAAPPTLMVCINAQSSPRRLPLERLHRFGVSILAAQHRTLAEHFLSADRIEEGVSGDGFRWLTMTGGMAVVEDAILAFDCEVEEVIERHAQSIVIGRVIAIRAREASSALVYWRGEYDHLGWTEAEVACAVGLRRV